MKLLLHASQISTSAPSLITLAATGEGPNLLRDVPFDTSLNQDVSAPEHRKLRLHCLRITTLQHKAGGHNTFGEDSHWNLPPVLLLKQSFKSCLKLVGYRSSLDT